MAEESPLIITISREFGSGGAYIGLRLAEKLNMLYVDREIINKAAQKLNKFTEELEAHDERLIPFWQSIIQSCAFVSADAYIPPEPFVITNHQLFQAESEIISGIASKQPSVIIGRGGAYILREHPRHVSIFFHADMPFRLKRIQELYNKSEHEALKLIKSTDRARTHYIHELTGSNLEDARLYHLSINTGIVGLDEAEKVILSYIQTRFGELTALNK